MVKLQILISQFWSAEILCHLNLAFFQSIFSAGKV